MKTLKLSTLRFAAAGLCLGLFGACMTDNPKDDSTGALPTISWSGKSMDSVQYASALLFTNGQLIVANRLSTDPGVAVIDTGTGKISEYYSEELPPSAMALTTDNRVILTETNYIQGAVSILHLGAKLLQKSFMSFGSDNTVGAADGKVFLFDRTTGVITGFTGHLPNANITLNVQTGAGSNPNDIAVSNGRVFIPRYNLKSLLTLDAAKVDGGARDSIDLSAYVSHRPIDTLASSPRMTFATSNNGNIFVALQRLNYNYKALDTSLVIVINASTKAVVATIPLHFKNPVSARVFGNTWYLTSIAGYGDQAGGVEKIDLSSKTNTGNVVTEASLVADVFDFVPTGDHSGYVSYSTDFGFHTKVKKVAF